MVHPLEHLEEHIHIPSHWDATHSETPFITDKMHPTTMHFTSEGSDKIVEWSSRRHRKGRNVIIRHQETGERITDSKQAHRIRGKKFLAWEPKNISWWVAQCFMWGSVSWVLNGFCVWLKDFAKTRTGDDMARITALVGGTIFLFGATLAYFEALNIHPKADKYIPEFFLEHHLAGKKKKKNKPSAESAQNENRDSSVALSPTSPSQSSQSDESDSDVASNTNSGNDNVTVASTTPAASPPSLSADDADSPQVCSHTLSDSVPSRQNSDASVAIETSYDSDHPYPPSQNQATEEQEKEDEKTKFKVTGSRWRDVGYIAAVSQLFGAYIFFISCITGMHNVLNENSVGQVQGIYWTSQVVGGMGFVISGTLYMYEVQPSWWQLRPLKIGWQIGFWNWLGAIGFTLSGIFGYYKFDGWGQEWGTSFSTFWGGWGFLIGSYVQFLEAINK